MFGRFSEKYQLVLNKSANLTNFSIKPEHLLLSLINEDQHLIIKVSVLFDLDVDQLRKKLCFLIKSLESEIPSVIYSTKEIEEMKKSLEKIAYEKYQAVQKQQFEKAASLRDEESNLRREIESQEGNYSSDSKKIIENSIDIARRLKSSTVETEHLFISLVINANTLNIVLKKCGLNIEEMLEFYKIKKSKSTKNQAIEVAETLVDFTTPRSAAKRILSWFKDD